MRNIMCFNNSVYAFNTEIEIITDGARYSDILGELLRELEVIRILRVEYERDYQGFVDLDCLLKDGKVFSYRYSYGSCSGCDEWESRDLSESEIKQAMMQEATLFNNIVQYNTWREMCSQRDNEKNT